MAVILYLKHIFKTINEQNNLYFLKIEYIFTY